MPVLPFPSPWLLAPMEGVTDTTFRDVVLERQSPRHLGGAFTEFLRVVDRPRKPRELREHMGPKLWPVPVGLQLMGADLEALEETWTREQAENLRLRDLATDGLLAQALKPP